MSNEDRALERAATPPWHPPASKSHPAAWLRQSRAWRWIGVIALIAGVALIAQRIRTVETAPPSRSPPSNIPVVVAMARRKDVPVYLNGLGSVTPYNMVTVKTRVDGQLDRVDFREGQIVHEGSLIAEIDPRPFQVQLDQAKGQLARDEAQLVNAKTTLSRYQLLWSQDSIARQDLDAQVAMVGQLEGTITSDRAAIASAQLNLTYSRIIAPITGRAGLRQVDPGNMVHAADTTGIVLLTQLEPIAVLFTLPEDSLQLVLKNMKGGDLPVDAFDRQGRAKLASGRLLTLDNRIDPTTGTFRIKAVFDNRDSVLFPEQFVNVRLLAETELGQIVVPSVAVQHGTRGPFVYAVDSSGTAHLRDVKTGISDGDDVVIASGVSAGDSLVVEGADRLRDGVHVDVRSKAYTRIFPAPEHDHAMSPSRPFILRPVATSLLMAAILLVGIVAYRQLPVSALPEVDYPTIEIVTLYPGAAPDVMASSVTAPLERQFGQIPGLKQMTSTSSFGSSVVTLQFDLKLDIDVAEQEVQAAINAGSTFLPTDLPNPPIYTKSNPADAPVLTLALTSASLPLPQVQSLADTRLAPKISQLPGVGLVTISGGQKPAVRVRANPTALAAYDLSLTSVQQAILSASVNMAKGSFDGPRQASTIGANDQLTSSKDYRSVIVAYRNGGPVRLSDVADVIDGVENTRQAAWVNQTPAVVLNIQRQPGANIITVVDSIKELIPQLTAGLPSSISVSVLTDRTTTIRASVHDVQFELILNRTNEEQQQHFFRDDRPGCRAPSR